MPSTINATPTSSGLVQSADASGVLALQTGGTTAVTIDGSQNVGIGTSSPQTRLQSVASGSGLQEVFRVGNTQARGAGVGVKIGFQPNNDFVSNGLIGAAVSAVNTSGSAGNDISLAFSTGSGGSESERMRITSNGMLAINTTTASSGNTAAKLVVKGGVGTDVCEVQVATNTTYAFDFRNDVAAQVGFIQVSAGSTTYSTTSDYRLKENIAPMIGALAKVAQLKPCTYTWKIDGLTSQGFIAHELQEIVPDCVQGKKDAVEFYTDEDGNEQTRIKPQGIDTSFLVATLTAAIQEQQALITQLQADVAALKAQP